MKKQYKAFISYAHHDERWAKWLQGALERYRIPPKLIQQLAPQRILPSRLNPIFRDREELASSPDLTESIKTALDQSEALVVVCSPAAAKSRWANHEIKYFRETGRADRIFCLLVEGSPERDSTRCAFPPALLVAEDGSWLPEPLAADVSAAGDGKRDAMLKIVAGLLGVGIDDLKQREAHRQLRFRGVVTAVSLVISIATIGMAIVANLAREDADIRRSQAENLISFMLEDLRTRLEPVGRLDILDAVGDEAMEYFSVIGDRGSETEVFSRAMALRQIGEVRFRQRQMEGAQQAFEDSRGITAALVTSSPQNQQYLFELGQAEFWVGYAALELSRADKALEAFTAYMEYSRQLLAMDPANPNYQLELMYAYSNLGTMELGDAQPESALNSFERALNINMELVESAPGDTSLRDELGNSYSWIGLANLQLNQLESSEAAYSSAVASLLELHESGQNRIHSEHFGQNNYLLGNVHLHQGNIEAAKSNFEVALGVFNELIEFDRENVIWLSARGISLFHMAQLQLVLNEPDEVRALLSGAISDFEQSLEFSARDIRVIEYLGLAEQARALLDLGNSPDAALVLSAKGHERLSSSLDLLQLKQRELSSVAEAFMMRGRILEEAGEDVAANATWREALEILDSAEVRDIRHYAIRRQLHRNLQQLDAAAEMDELLAEAGFADPRYL